LTEDAKKPFKLSGVSNYKKSSLQASLSSLSSCKTAGVKIKF